MMQDLVVEPSRVIAVLRRRVEELLYENAVLSAAVDQQRDEINELRGGPTVQVIIPGKPTRFALRLVAYAPNGGRLAVLPQHSGFEMAAPLNDVPGLTVTYPAGGLYSELIAGYCEVAVEYAVDGGGWAEPPNARFLRIKRGGESTDRAGVRSYDCPGWSWMLRKVVLYPNSSLVDGKRQFSAVSPGAILATFIQEGQARGALPGLLFDFSTTHDSAGDPWSKTLTLAIEPGKDLLTVLINLGEQGVIDWRMQGRTLQVFNPDMVLGADRAPGPSPVDLRLGRDITEAPDMGTLEDAASAILIGGEAGLSVEVINPSAVTPWGRWETYQSQGGVTDSGTATLLGQNALERVGRERVQVTRGLMFDAARWLPFKHYQPGDYLLAPGDGGEMQPLRLRQITLSVDKDGQVGGNVVLNDRFLEREIRLARQAAGILDGGVGSGGTGGTPAPEPGGRAPAKPQGLIVNASAYIDASGTAQGQITATWTPVAADKSGVAIEVDAYELYARENHAGGIWHQIDVVGETTATYSPLRVGVEYAFKVRAVADAVRGEFSEQTIVLVPDDTMPPPVPSTPIVTTRLGMIHVSWDGLGSAGEVMPLDFDRVKVWMADPLVPGSARVVDSMRVTETVVVPDQPYNADREFWLTAVDRSGNESGQSGHVTVVTQPLVDTDLIGKIIDGAHIVDGTVNASDAVIANTITGALIKALAIDTGHLRANAVTVDKLAAGSVTAGKLEALLILATRIVAGSPTAARVELNSTGLKAFNAGGQETLTVNASTGNVDIMGRFTSGASGKRLVINPNFGADPEIRLYEDDTNYHAITASSSSESGMRIISMRDGDGRYGYLTLSPTSAGVWGVSGSTIVCGVQAQAPSGVVRLYGKLGSGHANSTFARGSVTVGAGGGFSVGYGVTFESDMTPVLDFFDIGSTVYAHVLNAKGPSGFGWLQSANSGASLHDCHFFAWRH
ncbi:fibronectin type III domain-containing protein [Nonomuraea basaltis]|uniref:fibronectin type III domain-containing protein n=1 Tax=Nonomuraea basaltis TaxID=2495887 RepID=UPI00110C5AB6|nr:fibronectin type III domain-containing protein [Nonomuraea basaltis]TMR90381.1 fibronectin type III domain-containing protein [Nonomuraea basaltis]